VKVSFAIIKTLSILTAVWYFYKRIGSFMQLIKKMSYEKIASALLGKTVHFTSDCSLFPNFDVRGKVISFTYAKNGNLMFNMKLTSGRMLVVDSKMSNLAFELIQA
jgi:hypothetical protein